jgi:beta-N-acetylhexosaminidase
MSMGESTTLEERKRRAGQRMFIGLPGPSLDAPTRALIREIQPAGFILFARNVIGPQQVLSLNHELSSLTRSDTPAFLSVDQEGGRVQRIREPATRWPTMRDVAASFDDTTLTETVSRGLAEELLAMGFNLNFAPVADVDSNPDNPVIGDRSFGVEPARVAEHVAAFVRGHQSSGVVACAKHFPGHGDTSVDSHLDLPVVNKSKEALLACEWLPFARAVEEGVGSVMTAHVVFPSLDDAYPATLSPRVLRELLRERLSYEGVIFSDDMDMKAVAGRWPVDEQVRRATQASVDVLLCCNDVENQMETFRALVLDQEAGPQAERSAAESAARVHGLRQRFFLERSSAPPLAHVGCESHRRLVDRIREACA